MVLAKLTDRLLPPTQEENHRQLFMKAYLLLKDHCKNVNSKERKRPNFLCERNLLVILLFH